MCPLYTCNVLYTRAHDYTRKGWQARLISVDKKSGFDITFSSSKKISQLNVHVSSVQIFNVVAVTQKPNPILVSLYTMQ